MVEQAVEVSTGAVAICKLCGKRATSADEIEHAPECAVNAARKVLNDKPTCLECNKPATWIRATQFSGNHTYCDECAKRQEDFLKEDPSYFKWEQLVS